MHCVPWFHALKLSDYRGSSKWRWSDCHLPPLSCTSYFYGYHYAWHDRHWSWQKDKRRLPQTEICILSAYSDFHFAKEAMELHIKKYFSKPVSFLDISTYLENFSPSTYKSVCPQLSGFELANSQSFSETYAGLSSIINEIFSSQNASIESLKRLLSRLDRAF